MVNFIVLADPRSGSTLLLSYLRCIPQTKAFGEVLSTEVDFHGQSPLDVIRKMFMECKVEHKCCKLMTEQLVEREIPLEIMLRTLNASCVIIMYRKNAMECFVSQQVALASGIWYTETPVVTNGHKTRALFEPKEFDIFCDEHQQWWQQMADELPFDVQPIFVSYEELTMDHEKVMRSVQRQLGIHCAKSCDFKTRMQKQNPGPLTDKVLNPESITDDHLKFRFDVENIFKIAMMKRIGISQELSYVVPAREPHCTPTKQGWFYRVAEPWVNAKAKQYVMDAMDTKNISSGGVWPAKMSALLKEIFGVSVAIPCCNGYSALVCALQVSGIRKDDEVICPTFTMVAVLNAILAVGAKPVFVDNDGPNDYNPGLRNFTGAITDNTKAIIITHTYGVPQQDLLELCKVCEERNFILIEDISEAAGIKVKLSNGSQKYLGTFGDFAIASMYANKLITAGDGGFIFAKDFRLNSRLVSLINHGFTRTFHFVHFESAINAKINGLGAAFACGILEGLDHVIKHRQWLAVEYRKHLGNLPIVLMPSASDFDTPWVFGFQCEDTQERQELRNYLASVHVETRNFFYPLHLQPLLHSNRESDTAFSHANALSSKGLYLPTHTNLTENDVRYISQTVSHFYNNLVPKPEIPFQCSKSFLRFQPDEQVPVAVEVNSNNCITNVRHRGHRLLNSASLLLECQNQLIRRYKWDSREILISKISSYLNDVRKANNNAETMLNLYLSYFQSQQKFEIDCTESPWKLLPVPSLALTIPTTTDPETVQLLMWLVKSKMCKNILELGCLFGHASLSLAIAAENSDTFSLAACDAFKFQGWMTDYFEVQNFLKQNSFLKYFVQNVKAYEKLIKPVIWSNMFDGVLPKSLESQAYDLVFFDSTQDGEELQILFETVKQVMVPGKTIIVINGLSIHSLPFVTKYTNNGQIHPLYKPATIAQAFLFNPDQKNGNSNGVVNCVVQTNGHSNVLFSKYCFLENPDWTHHLDAYTGIMDQLRRDLHNDEAEILFLPSVENSLCNQKDEIDREWVGIIHNIPDSSEHYYSPSLARLCNQQYLPWMQLCRGLICLTSVQASYLEKHLLVKVPIQVLPYPFAVKIIEGKCQGRRCLKHLLEDKQEVVNCVFVGSFSRQIDLFYSLKLNGNRFQKCMLVGDDTIAQWSRDAPTDIKLINRLDENEYETLLWQSIIIVPLKCDGAANTIVVECIQRNVPIIVNKFQSVIDYLGNDYPLYLEDNLDEGKLLSLSDEKIKEAINYLENMDKERFHPNKFAKNIKNCLQNWSQLPKVTNSTFACMESKEFDVTIIICCYKRTHHLATILENLWNRQKFDGSIEIFIWNNNANRKAVVEQICAPFVSISNSKKSMVVIQSTKNFYCSVRLAMPMLMKSDRLLICDDDIVPQSNFISFFVEASKQHPDDLLCTRGHVFFPHKINWSSVETTWSTYEHLKFVDDNADERSIHFAHADACLIPKHLLLECCSVKMPDNSFELVDDYWMSFILNGMFRRNLRKLQIPSGIDVLQRADDSDEPGLALHTRPEVRIAKEKLYKYHMLNNWPKWEISEPCLSSAETKAQLFGDHFVGFNVSSLLDEQSINDLSRLGARAVRIGAVGIGRPSLFDFHELKEFGPSFNKKLAHLKAVVQLYAKANLNVIITLDRRLSKPEVWKRIASALALCNNVIGYDLVNEPITEADKGMHWVEKQQSIKAGIDETIKKEFEKLKEMAVAIREVDQRTPIIVEPTYWANAISVSELLLLKEWPQRLQPLVGSVHFYFPALLTCRARNKGRFKFPGPVPVYDNKNSELQYCNSETVEKLLQSVFEVEKQLKMPIVIGEFGVARDVEGAAEYLASVVDSCKNHGIPCFAYAFREATWEAFDYEFGQNKKNFQIISIERNPLMQSILGDHTKREDPTRSDTIFGNNIL